MVRKAGKHQTEANKQVEVLDPVHLLLYARWVSMNDIIAMLLLVSYTSRHNHLLYFGWFQCIVNTQNSRQNHTTKTLVRFDDHFPLNYVQMCGASVPSYLKILILPVDSHTFLLLLVLRIWQHFLCNIFDNAERCDEIIFWSFLDWTRKW